MGALPHEQEAAAGHGRGDGAERVDHAPHALLAVEPPHVEADRVIRGQPERAAGLPLVAGHERSSGTPVGMTATGARTPRMARVAAMCSDGAITRSAVLANRQARRTASPATARSGSGT